MIHSLKLLIRLVGTATGCLDPPTSTTAKASSWRSAIGDTDDFALQPIVSLKFIENLSIWFTVIQRDLQRRVSPSTSEIDEHVKVREVSPNNANGSLSINRVWPRSQQCFYYAQKCPRTSEEICAAWPVSTHLVKRS